MYPVVKFSFRKTPSWWAIKKNLPEGERLLNEKPFITRAWLLGRRLIERSQPSEVSKRTADKTSIETSICLLLIKTVASSETERTKTLSTWSTTPKRNEFKTTKALTLTKIPKNSRSFSSLLTATPRRTRSLCINKPQDILLIITPAITRLRTEPK